MARAGRSGRGERRDRRAVRDGRGVREKGGVHKRGMMGEEQKEKAEAGGSHGLGVERRGVEMGG